MLNALQPSGSQKWQDGTESMAEPPPLRSVTAEAVSLDRGFLPSRVLVLMEAYFGVSDVIVDRFQDGVFRQAFQDFGRHLVRRKRS